MDMCANCGRLEGARVKLLWVKNLEMWLCEECWEDIKHEMGKAEGVL